MKNLPLLTVVSTSCVAAILLFSASAAIGQSKREKVSLIKSSASSIVATFKSPLPRTVSVETQRGAANVYLLDGSANILTKGMPALPKMTKSIIVPPNAQVELVITDSTYKDIPDVMVAPAKGNISRDQDPEKVPFIYGDVYDKNEFFPGKLAKTGRSYTLRKYKGMPIIVYPLQYNPVTKVLRVYTSITVEARFTTTAPVAMLSQPLSTTSDGFRSIYKTQFLNYTESVSDRYTPLADEGTMLVVCHHDFMDAMKPFVDWKNQRGLKTVLVDYSTIATNADELKTYVSDYYHQNGLTFLLLVGDAQQIPSKQLPLITTTGTGYSDSYYGMIDGNDAYPEVIVGRFSAENASQVTTMVNRTISYEKDLGEDATWLSSAVGIASAEGGSQGDNGESDAAHMENIRSKLMAFGYTPVSQLYDPGASKTNLISRINEGTGVINYVGHGADTYWVTTGFGSSDMGSLTNTNRWPFIFDVACVNGNFVGQTCFAEAFTRASTANGPTGTVDIIASTINQSWAPPMAAQDEMDNILTESYSDNIRRTFGGIVINGCMAMNDKYGSDGDEITDFWAIFGDPSLQVRTKAPSKPIVKAPIGLFKGQQVLDVACNTNDATIALWQSGVILATAKTQSDTTTLSFEPIISQEPVILTVTGYNLTTIVDTLVVTESNEPYLTVSLTPATNLAIGDKSLNITIKNFSANPTPLTDITTTISSTDNRIKFIDSTLTMSSIGLDSIYTANAFRIRVLKEIVDQSKLAFTGKTNGTYNGNSYVSTFKYNLLVNAPKISASIQTLDDSYGNKNGNIDPGEFGIGYIIIKNTGHDIAQSPNIIFSTSDSTQLTVLSTDTLIGNLNVGEEVVVPVKFSSPITATIGAKVKLFTKATFADQRSSVDTTDITLGTGSYLAMCNGIYKVCNTKFFDSGGPNKNYNGNESYSITLTTGDPATRLKIKFLSFVTSSSDNMTIYDGPSTSYPVLGNYTGTLGSFELTSGSSYLTITFTSGNTGFAGWDADVQCLPPSSAPNCPSIVSPVDNTIDQHIPLLQWIGKDTDYYKVFWGTSTTPPLYDTTSQNNIYVNVLPNTTYYWKAIGVNQAGESSNCPIWSFTTGIKPDSLIMRNGIAYSCNAVFYDEGGPSSDYNNNTLQTLTIFPSQPGAMVKANFTNFAVETGYDYFYVWNGTDANAPLIGTYSSATVPTALQNVVASNSSGALTFRFSSDYYVTAAGWKAAIGCVLPSNTASATLHITDGTSPISGASITIGGLKYNSDANGILNITLPIGTNTIGINAPGYFTNNFSWNITTTMADTTITLDEQSVLNLSVTNVEDAHPVYPAKVTVNGTDYNANIGGIVNAPVATFPANWEVSSNGFQTAQGTTNSPTKLAQESVALTPINHVKILLKNSITEEPIPTGTVLLGPEQSLCGLDGVAHFITASGTYAVEASAAGYQNASSNFDINSANAGSMTISLTPNQCNLTILVLEAHTSGPVANATVSLNGQTYYTDATGKVVTTQYSGMHSFTVSAESHDAYSGSVSLIGTDTTVTVLLVTTGIDVTGNDVFKLYPNPASDEFTVETGTDGKVEVTIVNLVGATVLQEIVNNGSPINISRLQSGVYLVRVISNGKQHVSKLIVN